MTAALFVQAILNYSGIPYRWNGKTPQGFDCSGLAAEALEMVGYHGLQSNNADELYRYLKKNGLLGQAEVGALAFFGSETQVTHVGILISPTHMIEARGGDRLTLTLQDAISKGAFVAVRPVNHRADLVAIVRPKVLPWDNLSIPLNNPI